MRAMEWMGRRAARALIGGVGALCAGAAALGGGTQFGVNVDYEGATFLPNRPAATYGAAAGQPGFWNVLFPQTGTPSPVALNNLDGSPSGVTALQLSAAPNTRTQCVTGLVNINWSALMCDHAFNVAGVVNTIEIEFGGLPAGAYDLYTYACLPGETFQPGFAIGVTVDGVYQGTTFISGPVTGQTFQEGLTHDVRTITVDAGDEVIVEVFDTSGEFGDPIGLNGFQFVRTGEPVAEITDPTLIECVCDPVDVFGTAAGPGFSSYVLEYSPTGNDPWTEFASGDEPVTDGLLGTWDAMNLPEGHYSIRLTAQTGGGQSSTATTTVYLNQEFDPIDLRSPLPGGVYGGKVCFDGTVWDQCFSRYFAEFAPLGGAFNPVDPANPLYTTPVINDPIACWETGGLADGDYVARVHGFDTCGDSDTAIAGIEIDNTLPVVEIREPGDCASVCGVVEVIGTVTDANLESWVLQYAGNGQQWTTIASGDSEVIDGVLAVWDTRELGSCCYALRLIAVDSAVVDCGSSRNRSETVTTVFVGSRFDANGDGLINATDLGALIAAWGPACP